MPIDLVMLCPVEMHEFNIYNVGKINRPLANCYAAIATSHIATCISAGMHAVL